MQVSGRELVQRLPELLIENNERREMRRDDGDPKKPSGTIRCNDRTCFPNRNILHRIRMLSVIDA